MSVMMSLPGRLSRRSGLSPLDACSPLGSSCAPKPRRQREPVKGAADIVVADGDFSPAQLLASQKVPRVDTDGVVTMTHGTAVRQSRCSLHRL